MHIFQLKSVPWEDVHATRNMKSRVFMADGLLAGDGTQGRSPPSECSLHWLRVHSSRKRGQSVGTPPHSSEGHVFSWQEQRFFKAFLV